MANINLKRKDAGGMDIIRRECTKGFIGLLNTENRIGEVQQYTRITTEWV